MQQKDLASWEDFESELRKLAGNEDSSERATLGHFPDYLFRGKGNSDWELQTTLDRAPGNP